MTMRLFGREWQPLELYAVVITGYFLWKGPVQDFWNDCRCVVNTEELNIMEKDNGKGLLPVLNPVFNMREMCKQMVLLEDHLMQRRKRCVDCVSKHALTLEALAEEAITLDKDNKYAHLLQELPEFFRALQRELRINRTRLPGFHENEHAVAQKLRRKRKDLMPHCTHRFK